MIVEYMVRDNKPVIHVFWTDDQGIRHHEEDANFKPYFYVPVEENVPKDFRITGVENGEFYSIFGGKVKKVYTQLPSHVKEVRDLFTKTFEADVLFPTRYTIDKLDGVKGILRVGIADIETDDSDGMPDITKADKEIYCITLHDSIMNVYFIFYWRKDLEKKVQMKPNRIYSSYSSEEDMLNGFAETVAKLDPDVIGAWNTAFDVPYIIRRMFNLELDANRLSPLNYVDADREKIHGRAVFDILRAYKKIKLKEMRSYKLDYVAEVELGKKKLAHEDSIHEMWMNDIEKLLEYNIRDVELTVEINKKQNVIGLYDEVRRITKVDLNRVLNYSVSVDCALLSYCKGRFVLPTKKRKIKRRKIEGALVVDPEGGLFRNVIVCDITRSYPSAMISCNISPETFSVDGDIIVEPNLKFKSHPKGIIPSVLGELIKLRNDKKKEMKNYAYGSEMYNIYYTQQFALKSLINSFYGVMAFEDFRLYDQKVASAVTSVGRQLIRWCMKVAKDNGYRVIYGDTDSIFVVDEKEDLDEVIKDGYFIKDTISKSFDDFAVGLNVKEHVFDLDFDKVFSSILFTGAKKRYAGKLVWTEGKKVNKMKIVGFDSVRSDTAKLGKKIQEDLFMIMTSNKKITTIKDEVFNYLRSEINNIKKKKYKVEDVAFPASISRSPNEYKVKTMTVRAMENSMMIGKNYKSGDKPLLIPLKRVATGYPPMDVILIDDEKDLPEGFEIDYDKIIDKSMRMKVEDILPCIGLTFDEVYLGKKQSTLW